MTRYFLIAAETKPKCNSFFQRPYSKEKEFVVTSEQFDELMLKDKNHWYEYKEVKPKVSNPRFNVSNDWEVISSVMFTNSNYHIQIHEQNLQTKCLKEAGLI